MTPLLRGNDGCRDQPPAPAHKARYPDDDTYPGRQRRRRRLRRDRRRLFLLPPSGRAHRPVRRPGPGRRADDAQRGCRRRVVRECGASPATPWPSSPATPRSYGTSGCTATHPRSSTPRPAATRLLGVEFRRRPGPRALRSLWPCSRLPRAKGVPARSAPRRRLHATPLPGASVHGIFSAGLLDHLPDPHTALREWARVTAPMVSWSSSTPRAARNAPPATAVPSTPTTSSPRTISAHP
ncbi:class I SAM-dependent methyltransferase [Streptomyces venezuelae]|uniref:class I SAM-dependent methyltransferase n=1 Tax=Streptomyces venezuelae TaxID=54571 RepID=UPI003989DD6E